MHTEPNKKAIGLFLLTGITVLFLIVGQAVIGRLLNRDKYMAVMYFEESVKGLNVGSPVVFNGVEIGKVVKIELVGDPTTLTFQVPVYVQLTPMAKMKDTGGWLKFVERPRSLGLLIEKGLRARLLTQNYLTGQLMIELGMFPNTPVHFVSALRDSRRDIPEIPTILSPGGELSQSLQDLPLKKTFDHIENILTAWDKNMPIILPALARTSQNVEAITTRAAPATVNTINNMNDAMNAVSDAMRSLRNLTDYLEQYPESLLKGKRK